MTVTAESVARIPLAAPDVPRLADGIEFLGPYDGSGYQDPRFLISRADGQVIQVSEGLYRVAEAIDGHRAPAEIAARVAPLLECDVEPADVTELIETRLAPAGLLVGVGTQQV